MFLMIDAVSLLSSAFSMNMAAILRPVPNVSTCSHHVEVFSSSWTLEAEQQVGIDASLVGEVLGQFTSRLPDSNTLVTEMGENTS